MLYNVIGCGETSASLCSNEYRVTRVEDLGPEGLGRCLIRYAFDAELKETRRPQLDHDKAAIRSKVFVLVRVESDVVVLIVVASDNEVVVALRRPRPAILRVLSAIPC